MSLLECSHLMMYPFTGTHLFLGTKILGYFASLHSHLGKESVVKNSPPSLKAQRNIYIYVCMCVYVCV